MKILPVLLRFLCLSGVALVAHVSSAAISMTVDPGTKTIVFSGSDTGNSFDLFGVVQVTSWDFGASSGVPETIDVAAAFNEAFTDSAELTVRDGNLEDGLRLVLANGGGTANAFTDVTANSTPIDYSGLSAPFQAILESFGSDTLVLDQGTGYSNIDLTTVPEPGSAALLVAGALLVIRRRRR